MPVYRPKPGHTFEFHYQWQVTDSTLPLDNTDSLNPLFPGRDRPDDRRRLLDLTGILDTGGSRTIHHRIDRFAYRHRADWGTLTIGREPVTWGNGLVFNPMDIFNPFAPTDVQRDYKQGDDLVRLSVNPAEWNGNLEWQLLAVPRRDPANGSFRAGSSSLALKAHAYGASGEWDFLAAIHYNEAVWGIGYAGYFGQAVWRFDLVAGKTAFDESFLGAVVNIDYSWSALGRNVYGSLEFHYNSIGESDPTAFANNRPLLARLERGEQYTLGHAYLAANLRYELHPLLNLHTATLVNLGDPSAVFQPRLVWNPFQNLEISFGGAVSLGPRGTEFGGLPLPGEAGYLEQPNHAYLRIKGFF
jgi:hypothetical protein